MGVSRQEDDSNGAGALEEECVTGVSARTSGSEDSERAVWDEKPERDRLILREKCKRAGNTICGRERDRGERLPSIHLSVAPSSSPSRQLSTLIRR